MPGLQGQEHVGPHQQPQLILRMLGLQLCQRVGGKALSLAVHLDIQGPDPVAQAQLLPRQAGHLQPLLRCGAAGGQFLMGRHSRRDQQQLVQVQQFKHRPGSRQMAQVGRVEGAAVNSDFHSASFFFNAVLQSGDISDSKHTGSPPDFHRDRFFVGFTSWMRLSLGLLWLSRYSTNLVPMTWTTSARVAFASSSAAMRAS